MDIKMLTAKLKMRSTHNVDVIQVPLNDEVSPRLVRTAPFVAVDGEMLDEKTCRVWAETESGRFEVLWEGEVIGSLEHMTSQFASIIGITGKGKTLRA